MGDTFLGRLAILVAIAAVVSGFIVLCVAITDAHYYQSMHQAIPASDWKHLWLGVGLMSPFWGLILVAFLWDTGHWLFHVE